MRSGDAQSSMGHGAAFQYQYGRDKRDREREGEEKNRERRRRRGRELRRGGPSASGEVGAMAAWRRCADRVYMSFSTSRCRLAGSSFFIVEDEFLIR